MRPRTHSTKFLAALLALTMLSPAWGASPTFVPQLPDPGSVNGLSKDEQTQLGLKGMAEVYKQMPVLPDSNPVTQYVQQLAKRLETAIPPEHTWPYQFHVVQQSDINAFALPGGPIFVNIGTINAADNEAELAGVIAHEMSHVYMQHSAKQASKQSMAQGILGVIGGMLGGSTVGELARAGLQIGAGTIFLKYSRADEAQADAVGAVIMYRAGYNPHALADFFEKLEKQSGAGGPQFLSDHPNPGNRTASIENEIKNWPAKSFAPGSTAFAAAKKQASSIKAYNAQQIADGAKQGLWAQQNTQGGAVPQGVPTSSNSPDPASPGASPATLTNVSLSEVRPSPDFTSLQQGGLSLSYPKNWQISSDRNSLTIAPSAGAAQGAIAYGVMISTVPNSGDTIDDGTRALVQTLQKSNPGTRIYDSQRTITINGVEGRSLMLQGNSPVQKNGQPVAERDWLVTLPRSDGSLLSLIFISPEKDFRELQPTYQKMLDSLRMQ